VEHDEARTLISRLGVDFAQGHAIGMPELLDSVLEKLADLVESTA
jgi:EAL domain-containing protein (putative c-di-GMP-specific phosphodiesterase class I)